MFERALKSLRTIAFNRGVHRLQHSNDAYSKSPPMWKVLAEHERPHFFKKANALAWAKKHNLPAACIKEVEAYHSKPEVLRWYSNHGSYHYAGNQNGGRQFVHSAINLARDPLLTEERAGSPQVQRARIILHSGTWPIAFKNKS